MRVLHAVGLHEQFVASGVYQSTASGAAAGQAEHWSIYALPDGAWLIRVDLDRRSVDGTSTLIEGWRAPASEGGQLNRVRLSAFGKGISAKGMGQIGAHFSIVEQFVEGWRQLSERETFEMPITDATVLLPVSTLFMGLMLSTAGETITAVTYVPDGETIFTPRDVSLRVQQQGSALVVVDQHEVDARVFEVDDGEMPRRFWLDAHGIVLQSADGQANLTTQLTRYVRRPIKTT